MQRGTVVARPDVTLLADATVMAGPATIDPARSPDDPAFRRGVLFERTGVRAADGETAPLGTGYFFHMTLRPADIPLDPPPAVLPGEAVYGGVIGPHFGHVITQSIGRLWAADAAPPGTPLVFAPWMASVTEVPQYFRDLLALLRIDNPPLLLDRPTRVERLWIGPDLCNLDHRPVVEPWYRDWLRDRIPRVTPDPDLSIYVSRSELGIGYAQFLQEKPLEAALEAEGYRIVHPQKLSLPEQVDLYQRAGRLLFADGSAIHLWSLFSSPSQRVGIVLRRTWSPLLKKWFFGFTKPRLHVLDAIIANFGARPNARHALSAVLDMRVLWQQLGTLGFHARQRSFGMPTGQLIAWLEAAAATRDPVGTAPFDLDPLTRRILRHRPLLLERPL